MEGYITVKQLRELLSKCDDEDVIIIGQEIENEHGEEIEYRPLHDVIAAQYFPFDRLNGMIKAYDDNLFDINDDDKANAIVLIPRT